MSLPVRALVTFGAGVANEIVQVAWVHHAEAGSAATAAGVTLIMCTLGLLGLSSIVDAVQRKGWLFVVVAASWALGSALGTYAGVVVAKAH